MLNYDMYIFDFDGTIFNTNALKFKAFGIVSSKKCSGKKLDDYMYEMSQTNGTTRLERFKRLAEYADITDSFGFVKECIQEYEELISKEFMEATFVPGAKEFLNKITDKQKIIVSGGKREEMIALLSKHNILNDFSHVYGGEKSKFDHFRLIKTQSLGKRRVTFGDSKIDFQSSYEYVENFVFIKCVTQVDDISWFDDKQSVISVNDFRELV